MFLLYGNGTRLLNHPQSEAESRSVHYIEDDFDLRKSEDALTFLRELYNMASLARRQGSEIQGETFQKMVQDIKDLSLETLTTQSKGSQRHSDGRRQKTGGEDMNEAVVDAGYTLAWHHLPQEGKDILMPLYPVSHLGLRREFS